MVDLTSQYSSELLQIETSMSELQARKQSQLSRKRQLGRALLLYGSAVWMLLAAVLYLIELPNRTHFVAKCVRIGPLIGWPVGSESSNSDKAWRGIGISAHRRADGMDVLLDTRSRSRGHSTPLCHSCLSVCLIFFSLHQSLPHCEARRFVLPLSVSQDGSAHAAHPASRAGSGSW